MGLDAAHVVAHTSEGPAGVGDDGIEMALDMCEAAERHINRLFNLGQESI